MAKRPAAPEADQDRPVTTPSYPWYAKDWLTDETRLSMTAAERGIYRDLLDHQWVHGSIPKDINSLVTILNLNRAEVEAAWPKVRKKFQVSSENRSRLVNFRLETVRESKAEWLQKSVIGGQNSGNVRRRSSQINNLPKGGSTKQKDLVEAEQKQMVEPSSSVSVSPSEEERTPAPAVKPDQPPKPKPKPGMKEILEADTQQPDHGWLDFRKLGTDYGWQFSEAEWSQAKFVWARLDMGQRLAAVSGLRARIKAGDDSLVNATPKNYLANEMWVRRVSAPRKTEMTENPEVPFFKGYQ